MSDDDRFIEYVLQDKIIVNYIDSRINELYENTDKSVRTRVSLMRSLENDVDEIVQDVVHSYDVKLKEQDIRYCSYQILSYIFKQNDYHILEQI